MYHIVQENCFREENYENLILTLDHFNIEYEIVKVLPFTDEIEFKTNRKDVYVWGAVKLARIAKKQDWYPGSLINPQHDFNIYKTHYKENLFNYNSKIIRIGDDYDYPEGFFARPTTDGKAFTGKVFNREDFLELKNRNQIDPETLIQISGIKKIYKEIRFWIIDGKIITASLYKLGHRVVYEEYFDLDGFDFCNKMIQIFQLADAFVMDLCIGEDGWKIMELGCINSAGFYRADMQKLVMALEDYFNHKNLKRAMAKTSSRGIIKALNKNYNKL